MARAIVRIYYYIMPAVALTDHTTLAGAIRFYRAAQGSGVKPIIGTEIEFASGHHVTLLAKNLAGYSNLCRLLSELRLSQPGETRPLATWETLAPLVASPTSGDWIQATYVAALQALCFVGVHDQIV